MEDFIWESMGNGNLPSPRFTSLRQGPGQTPLQGFIRPRFRGITVPNLPSPGPPYLSWKWICPTQKRYWPMKPFRRVHPGQTFSVPWIDPDTGKQVVKALERKPLTPNQAHQSQVFFQAWFRSERGSPIPFNEDRILKFCKLACLCRSHFFIPRWFKRLGGGQDIKNDF